jgi:hypothetical protein
MKINKKDLRSIIEKAIDGILNSIPNNENKTIDETVFELDPNDPTLDQKMQDIENDSSIYNKDKDSITLGTTKTGSSSPTIESTYKKLDIIKLINETKNNDNNYSFTKNELSTKVLEKLYNGKLYKKRELFL